MLLQRGITPDIKEGADVSNTNNLSEIGLLIMIWLIPSFLFFPFGGILADAFDRRKVMTLLNIMGFVVTLGYLIPYYHVSGKWLIYVIVLFRQALAAVYEPSSQAILPMIVKDPSEFKKATIQCNMVHSLASTCGSALGGFFVSAFGLLTCLLIDSCIFLVSALVTTFIKGTWKAAPNTIIERSPEEASGILCTNKVKLMIGSFCSMFSGGFKYLRNMFFGPLIFLKFSSALLYGPLNSLLVAYSELYRKSNGMMSHSSTVLGILLACTGAGSILGAAVVEFIAIVEKPKKLQRDCIYPFLLMALAYILMGLFRSLISSCLCSTLIYCALTITWIESDLILQLFSSPGMMGRVTSIDFALAMTADGVSAYICGIVLDSKKLSVSSHYVSFSLGVGSFVIFLCWSIFHLLGRGAGRYSENLEIPTAEVDSERSSSDVNVNDDIIVGDHVLQDSERSSADVNDDGIIVELQMSTSYTISQSRSTNTALAHSSSCMISEWIDYDGEKAEKNMGLENDLRG
jgi:MFS family permease